MAVFQVDEVVPALRTSEVLANFKITTCGRVIYLGRAVVANVINAGGSLFCEAKLDSLGAETAFFLPASAPEDSVRTSYETFLREWQRDCQVPDALKVLVADVESYLSGTRLWLEQVAFGLAGNADQASREQAILEDVAPRIIAAFNRRHVQFEEMICAVPPETRAACQSFTRRHWHKLFLGSPFGHRTYHKPIGYAGDYEMMNMIYRNQPEGQSLYEQLIHRLLVSQWPAESVRNRIVHLREHIANEAARVVRSGRTARILNVGCGSAREIQDFVTENPLSNQADFLLVDFNEETLLHAGQRLVETKRRHNRRTTIRTEQTSVYELLKRTQREAPPAEKFDLIYCSGLFDYLAADTCRALMELWLASLAPGGMLLVANMTDTKPFRHFIEFVLDWQLIYRSGPELLSLAPAPCRRTACIVAEPAFVNLFLHLRKPD